MAGIINRYHWEHVGEHMLETQEHVGKPGGNTLGIRGK